MSSYLKFLQATSPTYYSALRGKSPGSASFNQAWRNLAAKDPKGFEESQRNFIKKSHFDPAASSIKKAIGFDVSKRSSAVQAVLWSVATQHGSGGAKNIFSRALGSKGNTMSDKAIIDAVYRERMSGNGSKYFSKSSQSIRSSVMNRFRSEWKDALAML
jgi:hypothetical protein